MQVNKLINNIRSKVTRQKGSLLKSGLFHFDIQEDGERSRVHLRVDPDGSGLLIVNANRVIHLNPTAVVMAYLILQNTTREQVIKRLKKVYAVTTDQAIHDYTQIADQLQELIKPDGACPIHDLDLEITPPFNT